MTLNIFCQKTENLYNWIDNLWLKVENNVAKGEILFVTMFLKSRLLQRRQKASLWGKGLKGLITSRFHPGLDNIKQLMQQTIGEKSENAQRDHFIPSPYIYTPGKRSLEGLYWSHPVEGGSVGWSVAIFLVWSTTLKLLDGILIKLHTMIQRIETKCSVQEP